MRKLSTWAKNNPRPSRLLIILFFIIMTGLGILTGILLQALGTRLSNTWLYIFGGIYLSGILCYPLAKLTQNIASRRANYYRQKSCDLLLAATTFLLVIFVSNRPDSLFNYTGSLHAAVAFPVPGDSAINTYLTGKAFSESVRDHNGKLLKWKERKKLLKTQVKAIQMATDLSRGAKVALIVLAVLLAIGLAYGVAVLACSISCSGSEAAAIVVAIGGFALVSVLLILAIRAILGKQKKKKPVTGEPGGSTG